MIKLFLPLLFLLLASSLSSQDLILTNDSKEINISTDYFLKIYTGSQAKDCPPDCDRLYLSGLLCGTTADSITLKVVDFSLDKKVNDISSFVFIHPMENDYYTLAKKEINTIKYYKSHYSENRKDMLSSFGGVLIGTGVLTGLSSLFVPDEKEKSVLIATGAQIGLGISLMTFSRKKKYRLKKEINNSNWYLK